MEFMEYDLKGNAFAFVEHYYVNENKELKPFWKETLFDKGKNYFFGALFKADLNMLRNNRTLLNHARDLYNQYAAEIFPAALPLRT